MAIPMDGKTASGAKLCALTFDDGPNATTTVAMLDCLAAHGAVGSFFLVGSCITDESLPQALRALTMGCDLQNHSWTHSDMTTQTAAEIRDEIARTSALIVEKTGATPTFFRPPYIAVNEAVFAAIDLPSISGINGLDWESERTAQERAEKILNTVADGSIILLHDFEGNEATVDALDILIPELRRRGFELVTIGELFRRKGVNPAVPGRLWSNALQTTQA